MGNMGDVPGSVKRRSQYSLWHHYFLISRNLVCTAVKADFQQQVMITVNIYLSAYYVPGILLSPLHVLTP